MRSIQASVMFPLSAVKPLERLRRYREYCLSTAREVRREPTPERRRCLACEAARVPLGDVEGFPYLRCLGCESLFLDRVAAPGAWAGLLRQVAEYRHSPETFHTEIAASRREKILAPRLDWIRNALLLQDLSRPRLLETVTPPSDTEELLRASGLFAEVVSRDEMALLGEGGGPEPAFDVAVMFESLDRVSDPAALLGAVRRRLTAGGLLFVTAVVASGFDMTVLG